MPVQEVVISALENFQKQFIWRDPHPKSKQIICSTYKKEGLKKVDINSKIRHLQCLQIQKFYDDSFKKWKLDPLYSVQKLSGKNLIFHSNLNCKISKLTTFPEYYRKMTLA